MNNWGLYYLDLMRDVYNCYIVSLIKTSRPKVLYALGIKCYADFFLLQKNCSKRPIFYKKIVGGVMAQKAKKVTRYINPETGEFSERFKWVDMQFDDEGYLFWNRKANIKTFIEVPLPAELTWAEKGRIHELKHYILKDNQFLVYRSGNTIKPITDVEMGKILGMSERQCRSLVKKMKDLKIIREISFDGFVYFVFNPMYGFKEKRLSLNVYLFFQDELRKILPEWVIKKFSESAIELRPKFEIIK